MVMFNQTLYPVACLSLSRGLSHVYKHDFQAILSLKPLDQSKPNCIWSRLGKGNKTKLKYKKNSFKSSENIQRKENGSDRAVSNNKFASVTLNKLAMKNREGIL